MAVKIKINQIRAWLLVVTDYVTHQHIDDVVVDGNRFLETRIFK